jgi:hypothetical protein
MIKYNEYSTNTNSDYTISYSTPHSIRYYDNAEVLKYKILLENKNESGIYK